MAIRCEFCGAEYEEDPGKFCDKCGRVLSRFNIEIPNEEGEQDHVRCTKCGHRNEKDAIMCVNCGERIYERQSL